MTLLWSTARGDQADAKLILGISSRSIKKNQGWRRPRKKKVKENQLHP